MREIYLLRHDRLYQQIQIDGMLILKSPVRIGGGREESPYQAADLSVVRLKTKEGIIPYIPGSSIKGLIRSAVEKVNKTLAIYKKTCTPTSFRESCGGKFNKAVNRIKNNEELVKFIKKNYCDVCKIFGTSGFRSNVLFSDCYPISPQSFTLSKQVGASMNRRLGGTDKGSLYQTEYIEPGSEFKFTMIMNNLSSEQIGLLFSGFKLINQSRVFVGSFTSKGFGQFEILFEKIKPIFGGSEVKGIKKVNIPARDGEDIRQYTSNVIEVFFKVWRENV